MTEADFLAALRALPLHPGALGLSDDAARLGRLVLTSDTLVEGVHYLASDPAGDVAWKLVATNLSDLAAKGAVPVGVMLNYPLRAPWPNPTLSTRHPGLVPGSTGPRNQPPQETPQCGPRDKPGVTVTGAAAATGNDAEDWDTAFLTGLADALTRFAAPILGGDTVSLPPHAPRVLTLTALGDSAHAPSRSGARAGDALYVTGSIGDAGAGLAIARGEAGPADLLAAYRRPQPRLTEGQALAPLVRAMMDVSDGLLIDAHRMAQASGLAVTIDLATVPLSDSYRAFTGDTRAARLAAATAGDDYQLLFALGPDQPPPVPATRIGNFARGEGLTLTDAGAPVALPSSLGFQHG
ncbi:thiamine-phosphate kinase [Sphingomonas echinoides]|uniref:Thiamine-monophosphate kinase n=1 Tax=Sphingomonas echinoides TaxID=59803 RepID=A0ABU4PV59_9SPHN|nr:thiamine-phosphate kinase [Sphingomonas echinoides]MDX5985860.1 thiamine-phosphate kinase [Sphingomonas echinoides]